MIALKKVNNKSDIFGIINSSICIAHCLATPILIGLGAYFLESPLFAYLFVAIAFASIFIAAKKNHFCKNKNSTMGKFYRACC